MPKPSIENIVVYSKRDVAAPATGKEWDVGFTCVTSTGVRYNERSYFGPSAPGGNGLTKAQLWDVMRAVANAYEDAERNPLPKQPPEFEGRLDATQGSPTPLALADYPVGEAPTV